MLTMTERTNRRGLPSLRTWFEDAFGDDGPMTFKSRLPEVFQKEFVPPLNVAETEKAYVVTLELPGMSEEDLHVQVMGNQLMITGEKKFEETTKDKEFHRVESQFGTFTRSVTLPNHLRTGEVDAIYENGMLTISVPKMEPTPTSRVRIRRK